MAAELVPPNCEVCKEDHFATHHCVDCAENMCNVLAQAHTRQKATRNHNVLTLEAFKKNPKPFLNCLEHNQAFAFYDTQCQTVVCRDCIALDHCGHKCISLAAAGVGCREKLDELAQKVTVLSNKMHDVETSVARVRQDLTLCYQQEDAKITAAFDQVRAALATREVALRAELAQVHTSKSFVLDNQLDLLRSFITRLCSVSSRAHEAIAQGGDVALLLARSEVTANLAALEKQPPQLTKEDALLTCTVNTSRALSLVTSMGKVSSNATFASTTTAEGPGILTARVGQKATFTITARDRQGALRGVGGDVFQAEVTGDEEKVLAQVSDRGNGTHVVTYSVPLGATGEHRKVVITLHGANICKSPFLVRLSRGCLGTFVRAWGRGNFQSPVGVAVSPAGEVFVVDRTNHRIQVFDTNGNFIRTWGSYGHLHGQFSNPKAVAVSPAGEVFVCEYGHYRVQVFDTNGTFLRTWAFYGKPTGQSVNPRGIAVFAEEVFVCEQNNHRVQVFSTKGAFIRTWGSSGSANGYFSCPSGIAVSPEGEVFVCDYNNHRIQVFDTHGTFIRTWGSKDIGLDFQPSDVAVSPAGEVIVTDSLHNCIQVFDTTGVFVRTWGSDGAGNDQFSNPTGVAVSLSGEIFVCDQGNNRMQVFQ